MYSELKKYLGLVAALFQVSPTGFLNAVAVLHNRMCVEIAETFVVAHIRRAQHTVFGVCVLPVGSRIPWRTV